MNFEDIGKRIKDKRLEMKLTQEQLAEKTGLTDTYIGAIERATSKCSIETLVTISKVLNINIDYLLNGTNINNVDNRFTEMIKDLPEEKKELFIKICESVANTLK